MSAIWAVYRQLEYLFSCKLEHSCERSGIRDTQSARKRGTLQISHKTSTYSHFEGKLGVRGQSDFKSNFCASPIEKVIIDSEVSLL